MIEIRYEIADKRDGYYIESAGNNPYELRWFPTVERLETFVAEFAKYAAEKTARAAAMRAALERFKAGAPSASGEQP